MKRCVVLLLVLLLPLGTALSQEKEKAAEPKKPAETEKVVTGDQLYAEYTIEDFETSPFSDKDMTFTQSGEQKAAISLRGEFPAPIPNSKKYLGLKIYGKAGDTMTISPPKKLIIEKFCRSIAVWVYGKNFSGELSFFLTDADGKTHRLSFGKLNFLGWRKLSVTLTDQVAQQDKYLTQKRVMEIIKITYMPGNTGRLPLWNYFYMDDITAQVREKYTDRQSDDW